MGPCGVQMPSPIGPILYSVANWRWPGDISALRHTVVKGEGHYSHFFLLTATLKLHPTLHKGEGKNFRGPSS